MKHPGELRQEIRRDRIPTDPPRLDEGSEEGRRHGLGDRPDMEAILHGDGIVTARLADAGCASGHDSTARSDGRGNARIAMFLVHSLEEIIKRLDDRHIGHLTVLHDKP